MPGGPVLAIFAHPDDAEISSGATLSKWCHSGRDVHLLALTNGDRGSEDPVQDRAALARRRAAEIEAAAGVLGLASTRMLDVHDGELENTANVRGEVVHAIREIRPETLLSCDPTAWFFESAYYNHADHRTAGAIARAEPLRGRDRVHGPQAGCARRAPELGEGEMLGFFEEWLPKEATEMGERIGAAHAEAFRVLDLS